MVITLVHRANKLGLVSLVFLPSSQLPEVGG